MVIFSIIIVLQFKTVIKLSCRQVLLWACTGFDGDFERGAAIRGPGPR